MIQTELLNEGTLIRHFSDDNHYIIQVETGVEYSEAIDVVPCRYTYVESENIIEVPEEENNILEENPEQLISEEESEVMMDEDIRS